MLFQIINKKTGFIILDNLTLNQMIKKVQCYFYQIDEYILESVLFAEKEFLIRTKKKSDQPFVEKHPKDFTVIVKRIE